jgi:HK97 family phage major capsid protein
VVPQGFSYQLEQAMKWFGGIEGTVGKFTTETGNPLPWPTTNDTTNRGRIIGQNIQVSETDVAFNQVTFNAYIGCSDLILVPMTLMEDSAFDMDALIAQMLGTRLGRLYNWKCTIGTGTAEPTGIVTAAVAAGNVYTCGSGEASTLGYYDLVNLEHSVDPAYRNEPSSYWMFSDAQLKNLKKLVDGNNRPLWQPGLTASFTQGAGVNITPGKPTILDHPYVINQDMAAPAANAYSALFGDMSTFKVRDLQSGTTVMRLMERYADYLQVGFIAFKRFDSNIIDAGTHPIAVLQQSAS